MKRIFIAIVFATISIVAYANENTVVKPTVINTEKTVPNNLKVESNPAKIELGQFRRQMNFTFTDSCGKKMTVYVSGGNSLHDADFWYTAYTFAQGTMDAQGCFPR
ncbi:hypothetical protein QWY86_19405 [Pedobacter aquatilis]|uniref:hypothetical protein n=1 Tax=Pedobacter aquatilis TaxID=351343 RepID=UPI0025B414DA|nr:hypothetical protein [Pedobacter aquatilis]MDN3588856.1 hypothetical protein [Pedobacter aquatilis]